MSIILFTPEEKHPLEFEVIEKAFELGLERLHIRKPTFSKQEYKAYILQIDEKYYSKIYLHQYHVLVDEFGLGGKHFRKSDVSAPLDNLISAPKDNLISAPKDKLILGTNENLVSAPLDKLSSTSKDKLISDTQDKQTPTPNKELNSDKLDRLVSAPNDKLGSAPLDKLSSGTQDILISTSTGAHSIKEALEQLKFYDTVFLSPVFASISKQGYSSKEDFNINHLPKEIRNRIIALGGIDKRKLNDLNKYGFEHYALLGAIWSIKDPINQLQFYL